MQDRGLIATFARHPVAGNLLMWAMILFGIWGLSNLSRQVLPDFSIDAIRITVLWPGASPEDVETSVLAAIEPEVRFLDKVDKVNSVATEGRGEITIDFEDGVNISKALTDVQAAVSRITTFPTDMERPVVSQVKNADLVCRIEISGPYSEQALKFWARRVRDDLLDLGLSEIRMQGLRKSEIHVEVPGEVLRELDLTINDVAARVGRSSLDLPSGSIETGGVSRQIRTEELARTAARVGEIELLSLESGERLRLKDVARVSEAYEENAVSRVKGEHKAIGLMVMREKGVDSIEAQRQVTAYLEKLRQELPPTLQVDMYDVFADQATQRVNMVVENGIIGFGLVLLFLYLFMNVRTAFWVAWGVPVSLLATLGVMAAAGITLNLISMFGLLMALGIIVDDAIVVSERAEALHRAGLSPEEATLQAVQRMWVPVTAACLTTVAAFMPVLAIGSTVGKVIRELPITVCVALLLSLVECLLVLPVHLRGAFGRLARGGGGGPAWALRALHAFRDGPFARATRAAFQRRYSTILATLCALVVSVAMFATGRVGFEFFASPETDIFFGNFTFAPGTPRERTEAMVAEMGRAVREVEHRLTGGKGGLIRYQVGSVGTTEGRQGDAIQVGDHTGAYTVELVSGDVRHVRNVEFIRAWEEEVRPLPGLQRITIVDLGAGGPPGRDIDIRLSGAPLRTLKEAALELQEGLRTLPGVLAISDNLPYGKQELVMALTPAGRAMGFTTQEVARQVRDAFEGAIAQRFPRDQEEVIVRVKLDEDPGRQETLRDLYIRAPDGSEAPLTEVVEITPRIGFSEIRRENGTREVSVSADIDYDVTTTNAVVAAARNRFVDEVARRYGISISFKGKAEEQARALGDFRTSLLLALSGIYLILAWVFSSYTRPLVVMSVIPFGLIGVVLGHWIMGFNVNLLSLQALLGLAGVIVNDSIVLIETLEERLEKGEEFDGAILGAVRERLRPVIMTTGTTVGGLLGLLFEGSLQAQLVQPIAVTLVFGLLVSPFLVFFFVPALLGAGQDFRRWRSRGAPVPAIP
jgi:multidrug efflux pump subunit AcrB